tara:strand:+ start:82174 stop:83028 length:855 start_codon:yes stop_codon:yes gene_type:complete
MKHPATALLALMAFFIIALPNAQAGRIVKVKGNKALVKLSKSDNFKKGQTIPVYTKKGKLVGKVKIVSVKKGRAVAQIVGKSKLKRGLFVRAKSKSKPNKERPTGQAIMVGGIIGMQSDTMTVEKEGDPTRDLAGSGFSVKAFADFPLTSTWNLRAGVGLQQLSTKDAGDSTCLDSDSNPAVCEVNINYFSADGLIRYMFSEGSFRPYAGAHLGLLVPTGSDVTAIDEDSVASTSFYGVSFGFDWHFGNGNSMIPFQVDYGLYPPSEDVSASSLIIKVGYGFRW